MREDGLNCNSPSAFEKILEKKNKVMFSKVHATLPINLQKVRFPLKVCRNLFVKCKAVIFKVIKC